MARKIIGLIGFAGAGKDSVANILADDFGFSVMKNAEGLKSMLRTFLRLRGVTNDEIARMIEGDLKELPTDYLGGKSPRHAMVTLGTEWGRDLISPNLWVDTLRDRINNHPSERIVVSDVRFTNEADLIREMGGEIWRIDRPGTIPVDLSKAHESETEMLSIPADKSIRNDGDLKNLWMETWIASDLEADSHDHYDQAADEYELEALYKREKRLFFGAFAAFLMIAITLFVVAS